jgi:hypothetical protein
MTVEAEKHMFEKAHPDPTLRPDSRHPVCVIGNCRSNGSLGHRGRKALGRPGTKVVCIMTKGYSARNEGMGKMICHLCQSMNLKLAFYDAEISEQNKISLNSNMVLHEADIRRIVGMLDGRD